LLTIPQAGELLNLSRDSVYDLIHAGSLKAVLVKGKFRVRLTDLHAFVRHLT
jgi:excisionase family DNA binding protein